MVVEYKSQIKTVLHARVLKTLMLQNCWIDAHRRLSRLLKRPSTCYEAENVRQLVSPLFKRVLPLFKRVLAILILLTLLLIWGISAITIN